MHVRRGVLFLARRVAEGSGSTMAGLVSISWPGHPRLGFVSGLGWKAPPCRRHVAIEFSNGLATSGVDTVGK
jgi:hypothetical protein